MDEFQGIKDLALRFVQQWVEKLELTKEAAISYAESCGKTFDQFDEFKLTNLGVNELTELIPDENIVQEIFNVFHYQLFLSVLPGAVADDDPDTMAGVLELNSYMTKSALLWAYFKGYQQGQNEPTADAFNDFISDLDLDD